MARYPVLRGLYELDKTIGSGGFAKVKLATHILTGERVAIKIMEKSVLGRDLPRVSIELNALKSLSHQHISQLYQVIETETHYFLVVEYCSGGELFDHIVEKNRLSEKESRVAFRQILSAVGYLHSLGFVHRDLKPENVLLDKDQNMKLIDFGLCAKPQGGLNKFLYTSCGSPTYAAPELVLGKKYLGSEVDVWSMGVLLYALLCGFLPFDDEKIDVLYKKILSGKYEEPKWLSQESKKLICSMLQVNNKHRITIEELCEHPWVMQGFKEPVSITSLNEELRKRDEHCVNLMARHKSINSDEMWKSLSQWKYNYDTATYLLMLNRKRRGLPVRLFGPGMLPVRNYRSHPVPNMEQSAKTYLEVNSTPKVANNITPVKRPCPDVSTPVIPDKRERPHLSVVNEDHILNLNKEKETCKLVKSTPKNASTQKTESTPISSSASSANRSNTKRGLAKRLHSPGPEDSPLSPRRANKEARKTPIPSETPERSECSSTAGRGIFGSIERSLNRVRHILTPRRRLLVEQNSDGSCISPAILSGKRLCNVSTASGDNPEQVLKELQRALSSKGITCKQNGYILRGKVDGKFGPQLSFELEVCYVLTNPDSVEPLIGIRRKRLKGDSWCYKKVCEEVLALAQQQKSS